MNAKQVYWLGLVVSLLGCTGAEENGKAPRTAGADQVKSIEQVVFEAQRAGFERHDLKAYMRQWTDDAQIVLGRSAEPDKSDVVLDRKQIEATRRLMFRDMLDPALKLNHEDVQVEVTGDRAELRVRTTATFEGGFEAGREIYRLRKTPDGWKVFLNRWWPTKTQSGAETITYDAATWKSLDDRVTKARQDGDPHELISALRSAYRFAEAHATARKLTDRPDATVDDWVSRGFAALYAGDADDTLRSFEKARTLDPDASVPPFARGDSPQP